MRLERTLSDAMMRIHNGSGEYVESTFDDNSELVQTVKSSFHQVILATIL